MTLAWFTARGLFGLKNWLIALVAVALIAGLIAWFATAEKADDKMNQDLGATKVENKNLQETINRVEKADDVRETVVPGNRAYYDECLRSARTPANCERFLPR